MQAVFSIGLRILSTVIWACPDSILSKVITTSKLISSFLISVAHEHNNENN